MTLQARIRLANIERARQRYANTPSQGYRPPRELNPLWDAATFLPVLAGAPGLLALAIQWVLP